MPLTPQALSAGGRPGGGCRAGGHPVSHPEGLGLVRRQRQYGRAACAHGSWGDSMTLDDRVHLKQCGVHEFILAGGDRAGNW